MLPPAKDDLLRRRWIWQALSDLFLDEEITADTLRYIARIAAECGYSAEDLEAIYRREVAPAVAFNVFDIAGTWGYFDSAWLEARILRPHGLGYWFDRFVIAPGPVWALREEWQKLRDLLAEQGECVREERRGSGSEEAPRYRWTSRESGLTDRSGPA